MGGGFYHIVAVCDRRQISTAIFVRWNLNRSTKRTRSSLIGCLSDLLLKEFDIREKVELNKR
jgi:hypothetical protein